jgi:micrococcal nuclease
LILCFFLLGTPLAAREITGIVSWVYDGDSLQVENVGKIRLLGIDAPEHKRSSRDRFYLNNFGITRKKLREVSRHGKQLVIELSKGKQVRMVLEADEEDQHGRKLVYLYLPDGRMLNRLLLEKGLVSAFRRYQYLRKEEFLAAEESARLKQVGLWQQ